MKFVFAIPLKFLKFHPVTFTNLRKGEIFQHFHKLSLVSRARTEKHRKHGNELLATAHRTLHIYFYRRGDPVCRTILFLNVTDLSAGLIWIFTRVTAAASSTAAS